MLLLLSTLSLAKLVPLIYPNSAQVLPGFADKKRNSDVFRHFNANFIHSQINYLWHP